jgi:hypothetical protein
MTVRGLERDNFRINLKGPPFSSHAAFIEFTESDFEILDVIETQYFYVMFSWSVF